MRRDTQRRKLGRKRKGKFRIEENEDEERKRDGAG